MSYILDALRKSEQERQQAEPIVAMAEAPRALALPRRGIGMPLTTLALAAAVAILAGAWWVFSADLRPAVPVAPAPAASERTPAPAEPAKAPPSEAAAETPPAPELKPSPFATAPRRPPVRDLARETRVDPPARPAPPPALAKAPPPAPPAASEPAPPAPVKFLRAMPDEFRRSLPPLAVTIHIYAPRPADRILYINNKQYQAGDRVGDGLRVEEIVRDGAVLSYRGQRFKLARPS